MAKNNYMDINSLTDFIPLTKSTIYSMVSRKQIPYKKIRKKLIFNKEDIINWINNEGKLESSDDDIPTLNI